MHPEIGLYLHAKRNFIFHRTQNPLHIQLICYTPLAHSFKLPLKDCPYHLSCISINHKLIMVFFIFQISIHDKSTNELSLFPFNLQLRSDFHRNILTIGIVNQILKRNNKRVRLVLIQTVVTVIDCYKTHSHKRKYSLNIVTGFNIISSKAGQIFDNHAVHLTGANFIHHLLECGSVKIDTGISIICFL